MKNILKSTLAILSVLVAFTSCNNSKSSNNSGALSSNVAEKVYVAPGEHDSHYAFISGGYSGNLTVYGLPSGRMFKEIPVFSQFPTSGYGYSEETKPMLNTSHGFIPWGDSHHPDISQTNGEIDGRFIFINENNTPRIAKIDLKTFETTEIIEVPNSAGNHSSSFVTENTEYVVAGTRFSVPVPQRDMPIKDYKGNFQGALSFISVEPEHGHMDIKFQVLMPGFNYDLAHPGRGASHGWFFFSTYNTEEASTLLEVNASQNDKDFIAAINWKKIEEYVNNGGGTMMPADYAHNVYDEHTHTATSTMKKEVLTVDPLKVPGAVYFLPTPKSPHGCDVDPTGQYIIGNGKLSADLTVHSFDRMIEAIEGSSFIFIVIIIVFFSGELIWRDRESKINEVIDATPHISFVSMFAKAVSLISIVSIVHFLFVFMAIIYQFLSGYGNVELDVYFISYLPSQLLWSDVAMITSSALLLSFLATIYPAIRASKIQPAEALRYE